MSPAPPLPITPRVRRWRLPTGVRLDRLGVAPLGVLASSDLAGAIAEGDAVLVVPPADVDPESPWALAEALPDPRAVAGALVVVAPRAIRSGLLARLRRNEPIARSVRGAALLLRGYRHIGGGFDPGSGLDLAWGE